MEDKKRGKFILLINGVEHQLDSLEQGMSKIMDAYAPKKEKQFEDHVAQGCRYGQPDSPDSYIKDCDCEEVE